MIYLLRHGETEGSETKRYIGHTDIRLSHEGIRQAEYWQETLSDINFQTIISSDLSRTKKTAEIIKKDRDIPVIYTSTLREINLGNWDGRKISEIKSNLPEQWKERGERIATYRTPGGESFQDLENRVIPYFKHLDENKRGDILIVTHAGLIRVLLSHILNRPLDDLFRLKPGYGDMFVLNTNHNKITLYKQLKVPVSQERI